MKKLLTLVLVAIVSGCATPMTQEEIDEIRAEDARRVKAMIKAGMNPYADPGAYNAWRARRDGSNGVEGLQYMNDQWRRPAASQEVTAPGGQACRQVSLRDPATGLFKQYRICD